MSSRFHKGDFAYLRVRYVGGALSPAGEKEEKAAVEVVNRVGVSDGAWHYVDESALVTPAEAMRAVRGVK